MPQQNLLRSLTRSIPALILFSLGFPLSIASLHSEALASPRTEFLNPDLQSCSSVACRKWVDAANRALHPALKGTSQKTWRVALGDCGRKVQDSLKPSCGTDAQQSHSHFCRKGQMLIVDHGFSPEIEAGPEQSTAYSCGPENGYQHALTTLLTAVFEIHDKNTGQQLSRAFGIRTGWRDPGLVPMLKKGRNHGSARAIDSQESRSLRKAFAVHAAYFSADPKYSCRKPATAIVLAELLLNEINVSHACEPNLQVQLSGESGLAGRRPVRLDPSRVYAVHYLFAAGSEAMMSRWGHAMFRIIVCAPHRKMPGPECLSDMTSHLVLSYVANVDEMQINSLKGLMGGYDSRPVFFHLSEIVRQYTERESRDLWSLPLQMSAQQKQVFLLHALEQYWEYTGTYRFLTNNCATEARSHLNVVFGEDAFGKGLIANPRVLFQRLGKSSRSNAAVLQDPERARSEGYFFPSKGDIFERNFTRLRERAGDLKNHSAGHPIHSFVQYAKSTTAAERYLWLQQIKSDPASVALFHLLERQVEAQLKTEAQKKLIRLLLSERDQSALSEVVKGYAFRWYAPRYGIPLTEELDARRLADHQEKVMKYAEWIRSSETLLQSEFPELHAELEAIQENLRHSGERMIRNSSEKGEGNL